MEPSVAPVILPLMDLLLGVHLMVLVVLLLAVFVVHPVALVAPEGPAGAAEAALLNWPYLTAIIKATYSTAPVTMRGAARR